jgi:hypothetical protein
MLIRLFTKEVYTKDITFCFSIAYSLLLTSPPNKLGGCDLVTQNGRLTGYQGAKSGTGPTVGSFIFLIVLHN